MTSVSSRALVPLSPARTHETAQQRQQMLVRRAYGAGGGTADRSFFSREARDRQQAVAAAQPVETPQSELPETPYSRQMVRQTYAALPLVRPAPPAPGSFIDTWA